jgi:hypothetical protein
MGNTGRAAKNDQSMMRCPGTANKIGQGCKRSICERMAAICSCTSDIYLAVEKTTYFSACVEINKRREESAGSL